VRDPLRVLLYGAVFLDFSNICAMINKKELDHMTSWEKFKQEWRDFFSDAPGKVFIFLGVILLIAWVIVIVSEILLPY